MSKAVLISIRSEWCEKIASGRKTIELRKTKPKLALPFKCYIYCTQGAPYLNRKNSFCYLEAEDRLGGKGPGLYERLNGKIIGEFVCDCILGHCEMANADIAEVQGLVRREKILEYAGEKEVFGWHISDLIIYDKPKGLSEFSERRRNKALVLSRPPQSWCYVEELTEGDGI